MFLQDEEGSYVFVIEIKFSSNYIVLLVLVTYVLFLHDHVSSLTYSCQQPNVLQFRVSACVCV